MVHIYIYAVSFVSNLRSTDESTRYITTAYKSAKSLVSYTNTKMVTTTCTKCFAHAFLRVILLLLD